tara:strand:+ start:10027 stop:10248 length:222 start_codon:yes stop_codon:yes gene_type:complete
MIKLNLQQLMLTKSAETGQLVTIDEICKATGLGRNTLSRIKNNPNHKTTTDVINTLCNYFECSVEELVIYEKD